VLCVSKSYSILLNVLTQSGPLTLWMIAEKIVFSVQKIRFKNEEINRGIAEAGRLQAKKKPAPELAKKY